MTRDEVVLAAMAAGGAGATYSPVQVQKLFFLIDTEAAHLVGGKHFNFQPYDYGPFDRGVYDTLEALAKSNLAVVSDTGRFKTYSLTGEGIAAGERALATLSPQARSYVEELTRWLRGLSFEQLVSAIYKRYPEMRVNSVFRG